MNPIYKFQLSAGNDTRQAFPVYKDDLAIDYALEQNQEFYRGKLSGKLTFQKDDYLFIRNKAFDTQFDVVISISYDGGQMWAVYWSGQFWKTDCQFNEDDQTAIVTPNVNDRYNAVLDGMEKEYNLIDLAPVIQPVKLDKRPMIQVYVPGQTVIGCFLSGMWWEQECESVLETDTVKIEGKTYPALEYKYHFALNKKQRILDITQTGGPALPDFAMGAPDGTQLFDITKDGYRFRAYYDDVTDPENPFWACEIARVSDNIRLWLYKTYASSLPILPYSLTLTAVEGTGATGTVELYVHDIAVYARYITDVEQALGLNTYPIPGNDIVENNRNYHYVIGYYFPDTIFFNDVLSTTPTQWGIYQPGQYYVMFTNIYIGVRESFPVSRSAWGRISIWFAFDTFDWHTEQSWRKEYTLKDAFPIWSVISVLLAKVAPAVTHDGTTDYSQFLYDTNPITSIDQRLFITPKSNLISAGYDQPAQKAPITLKRVTDMLRDCFRCYWFIDEQNRFRIEHISYFMRGGTYTGQPVIGMDLTKQVVTRNGKPWSYARNQYEFDKPEMASRYQFGWMDNVTQLFDGYPIDIISKYVNPDNIEQIDVSQFTSDVDYILLNHSSVSKDGFVLLAGTDAGLRKTDFNLTGYWSVADGQPTLVNNYGYVALDLVKVEPGQIIRFRNFVTGSNSNEIMYLYGPDKSGIRRVNRQDLGLDSNGNADYVIPAGVGYVGICWNETTNFIIYTSFGDYKLPYVNFDFDGTDHILQNAWVSFMFLQRYYMFDMPARNVQINGVTQIVQGIKKLKTQTIKFPVLTEPDMFNLIKTGLGNGTIQKMSVNLSSRNANTTLKYDTE